MKPQEWDERKFIADNAAFWTCLMAWTTQLKSMRNEKTFGNEKLMKSLELNECNCKSANLNFQLTFYSAELVADHLFSHECCHVTALYFINCQN